MILHYEEQEYPITLYHNGEVVDTIEKIDELKTLPRGGDNVYAVINGSYHFYETPWEYDDRTEVELELDGVKYSTKIFFKNKTKQVFVKDILTKILGD